MERSNLFKLTGLAAAIMFSTGTLAAGDKQASFQQLDQNSDGKLTPSELSQKPDLARQWNEIDQNNDNAIERAEFSAFQEQQGQSGSQEMASQKLPKFEELDHNGDGKLTTSEVGDEAALTAQWTEIDKDDSDTLDRSEFSAFEEQRQQRELGGQQQQGSKSMAAAQLPEFDKLDKDSNGKLTPDEVSEEAALTTQWTEIDKDDSDTLDRSEFSAFEEQRQQGSPQQQSKQMSAAQLPEFDKLDKDRNGQLTPDEVSEAAAVVTQWTEIDKDDSDTLDRTEFSAFEESYRSEQQEQQEKQQPGQEGAATQGGAAAGATAAAGSQGMQQRGQIDHPLYSMSPDELQGQEVMGSNGQKLGTVSKVVSDRSSGRIHVVVSGGGFLGIASRENAIPLDELQMQEGVLQAPVSEQEVEGRGEYTEDAYVEVEPEDRPISEFSAFEEPIGEDESLLNPDTEAEKPRSGQYGQ